MDKDAEALINLTQTLFMGTENDIMDFINTTPIHIDQLTAFIKTTIPSPMRDSITVLSKNEVLYKWLPYIVKVNNYDPETIMFLTILSSTNLSGANGQSIIPVSKDKSVELYLFTIKMLPKILYYVQYTELELSDMIEYACKYFEHSTNEAKSSVLEVRYAMLSCMGSQKLSIKFIEEECMKYYSIDPPALQTLLQILLPALSDIDAEQFVYKYAELLSPDTIFRNVLLSDGAIISYLFKYGHCLNTEEYINSFAQYRKLSPTLINYLIKIKRYDIIKSYDLSFTSKPMYFKKAMVEELNEFECKQYYFYAYKAVDLNDTTYRSFRCCYKPGKTYETTSSGGDSVFTQGFYVVSSRELAQKFGISNARHAPYRPYKVIKVKIKYSDVTHINAPKSSYEMRSVRCSKFTVCED